MKRRIIACIFAMLILFSLVFPIINVSAETLEQERIVVGTRNGYYIQTVYTDSTRAIFVPITMLQQFGGMASSADGSDYTFYYKNEASRGTPLAGARRIIIDKSGKTGKVVCYTSSTKYTTIESISFSKAHTVNKKLYLPIEEFLPLLDAKVEITSDGIVYIYKNPVPFYHALFSSTNLDVCIFDKDDIVLDDVITATGLIVDSILGLKFDRLDLVTNTGAIKDYSNLFKKLLTDNETYLSAFDNKETPLDKAIALHAESAGDAGDAVGGAKDMLKLAEYMSTSKLHDTYKEFSDSVKKFGNAADVIEGAIKVVEYADAYYNQVDDHRDMLTAVYGSDSTPAAVAANQIYNLYSKDRAGKVTSAAASALRDYITKELSGAITKGYGLTPYKIAFSAVKLVIPDAVKEFSKAAELYYLDKVINDAYKASTQRLNNMKYDAKSLDNLRLSLIMTLIASKYGYETHFSSDRDEVKTINTRLEKLYLAADSIECVAKGYYSAKKKELSESKKYIVSVGDSNNGNTGNDNSTKPSDNSHSTPIENPTGPNDQATPLKLGDHIYFGSAVSGKEPEIWQVVNIDGSYALIYNLYMYPGVFDATTHAQTEAVSLTRYNSFGSATWEYSDVRSWLNSRDAAVQYQDIQFDYSMDGIATVPWPSEKTPTYIGSSAGYLNRFTAEEYSIIQPVTHQSLIPYTQSGKSSVYDADFKDFTIDLSPFYQEPFGVSETTDLVFLLNGWEFKNYVLDNNLWGYNYPNGKSLANFWLRDSVNTDFAGFYGYFGTHMLTAGNGKVGSSQADSEAAIRPACYIDMSFISVLSGSGSFEDPYHLMIDPTVIDREQEAYYVFTSLLGTWTSETEGHRKDTLHIEESTLVWKTEWSNGTNESSTMNYNKTEFYDSLIQLPYIYENGEIIVTHQDGAKVTFTKSN